MNDCVCACGVRLRHPSPSVHSSMQSSLPGPLTCHHIDSFHNTSWLKPAEVRMGKGKGSVSLASREGEAQEARACDSPAIKAHPEALVGGSLPEAHLGAHCFAALLPLRRAHLHHTVRHKASSTAPALLPLCQRSRRRSLGGALALRQHPPHVGRGPRATASDLQDHAPLLSTRLWAPMSMEVRWMIDQEASAAGCGSVQIYLGEAGCQIDARLSVRLAW